MDSYIENNTEEYPIVAAYGDYEVAKALAELLIMNGNPIGEIFELECYDMSHYDREYVIYLSDDGVTCEKCYHDGIYYLGGGDISFVHEDCNSKLLGKIESDIIYEFGLSDADDECDCDGCCERCECDKENELVTGFIMPSNYSTATYMVNGKEVDEKTYGEALEEINARLNSFENTFRRFMRSI